MIEGLQEFRQGGFLFHGQGYIALANAQFPVAQLAQRVAPDFALEQAHQAALFQFLQIGQAAARFGIDPGDGHRVRLVNKEAQGRAAPLERFSGFAQAGQFRFGDFGRHGQLRHADVFGAHRRRRQNGLFAQHPALDQGFGGFAPLDRAKVPVDLPSAQGVALREQVEQAFFYLPFRRSSRGAQERVERIGLLAQAGRQEQVDDRRKRIQGGLGQLARKSQLRPGQHRLGVEEVQDGFWIRHRGRIQQIEHHPLDGLRSKRYADQLSRANDHSRRQGVIELAGNGGQVDGDTGEGHAVIIPSAVTNCAFLLKASLPYI